MTVFVLFFVHHPCTDLSSDLHFIPQQFFYESTVMRQGQTPHKTKKELKTSMMTFFILTLLFCKKEGKAKEG